MVRIAKLAAASKGTGRRERKQAETREKLFRCATELFAKHGFADTRVEQITEAADVAKGTFFNYFQSKEHLLIYFAGRQIEKVDKCLAEAQQTSTVPIGRRLRALAHDLLHDPGRTPELARSVIAAFVTVEAVRNIIREHITGIGRQRLSQIIQIGQDRGELRDDHKAIDLARTFQQTMFGTMLLWSLNPNCQLDELIDLTVDVLLAGIRSKRAAAGTTRHARRDSRKEGKSHER